MKITINTYNSIALWRWNLQPPTSAPVLIPSLPTTTTTSTATTSEEEEEEEEEEDEEDVCGICRVAYEGCCPDCKTPGDECPLSE
jgi:anaphase-promoting complex subunit 11